MTAAPSRSEEERSFALLTDPDVGMSSFQARYLASKHSFASLLTHVFSYRREAPGAAGKDPSALKRRIEYNRDSAFVAADRDSALWRRHVRPEEESKLLRQDLQDGQEERNGQ